MTGVPPARRLLESGVPLTLLLDLAEPAGPDSRAILRAEEVAADAARSAPPVARATRRRRA